MKTMINNLKVLNSKARQKEVLKDFLENKFITKKQYSEINKELGLKGIRTSYKKREVK